MILINSEREPSNAKSIFRGMLNHFVQSYRGHSSLFSLLKKV